MKNYAFFTVININSFALSILSKYSVYKTYLLKSNLQQFQKDCRQDDISFAYLQFYKHNCLNILAGNICLRN